MARGHAEVLMPMIERVVGRLKFGFDSLDKIAVTVGPGSFTGIRVGVAAAKAQAQSAAEAARSAVESQLATALSAIDTATETGRSTIEADKAAALREQAGVGSETAAQAVKK